jgi:hypothetical protein
MSQKRRKFSQSSEPLADLVVMGKGYWQARNVFVVPDPSGQGYPVRVGDLNGYTNVVVNGEPRPGLRPSSFAEAWFPSNHMLVVYPDPLLSVGPWGAVGERVDLGEPSFEKVFDVRSDDAAWARLVLNPAVMDALLSFAPVRVVIDAGRVTVATTDRWVSPDELSAFIDLVRSFASSARAGQA